MMKTSLCLALMTVPTAIDALPTAAVTLTDVERIREELQAKSNEMDVKYEELRTEMAQLRAAQGALINENNPQPEPQGADEEGADPSVNEVGAQCCWSTPACQRHHPCGGRRLLQNEFRATPKPETPEPQGALINENNPKPDPENGVISSFTAPEQVVQVREMAARLQEEINKLTRNNPKPEPQGADGVRRSLQLELRATPKPETSKPVFNPENGSPFTSPEELAQLLEMAAQLQEELDKLLRNLPKPQPLPPGI